MTILKLETLEFIGGCGIHKMDQEIPGFGIWTKKSSHGNKYGREAVEGLKDWATKNLNYPVFKYPVAKANTPSRKVAESLGGKFASTCMMKNQFEEELDCLIYHIPMS